MLARALPRTHWPLVPNWRTSIQQRAKSDTGGTTYVRWGEERWRRAVDPSRRLHRRIAGNDAIPALLDAAAS